MTAPTLTVPDGSVTVGNKSLSDLQNNASLTILDDSRNMFSFTADLYHHQDFVYDGVEMPNANIFALKVVKDPSSRIEFSTNPSHNLEPLYIDQDTGLVVINDVGAETSFDFLIKTTKNGVVENQLTIWASSLKFHDS